MYDFNCPHCGEGYDSDDDVIPDTDYFMECSCGHMFVYSAEFLVVYSVRALLFPEREDAEEIDDERHLLSIYQDCFSGTYDDYVREKRRLVEMLKPVLGTSDSTKDAYQIVYVINGRFKTKYYRDENFKVSEVYDYKDFKNILKEWKKTSKFIKEG